MGPDHDEAEDGDVERCRDGSATEAAGAFKVKHSSHEGLNFSVHVVGLEGGEDYLSRLALGRLARAQLEREPKRQARPLLVKEVAALEEILRDESVDEVDRYATGVFLFNVYSRSRWSDIRAVCGFVADLDRSAGCSGYLEFSTRSHKTSRLVARQGLVMPLVCPAWGITSSPWGLQVGRAGSAGASGSGTPAARPARLRLVRKVSHLDRSHDLVAGTPGQSGGGGRIAMSRPTASRPRCCRCARRSGSTKTCAASSGTTARGSTRRRPIPQPAISSFAGIGRGHPKGQSRFFPAG